jgi:hypothetical protein
MTLYFARFMLGAVNTKLPHQLEISAALSLALMDAAVKSARLAAQSVARYHRKRVGQTLKPSAGTPLWNELAGAVRAQLTRYGEKARLGRVLGLPRQRVHELLKSRKHLPDAERTLLLLAWLHARSRGSDLA